MKREIDVTAYRMLTEYDKKDDLVSTVELRVPAEELEFFQEAQQAQEDEKDVRSTLVIRGKDDGSPRRLALNLKSSKMKNFVPVAVFTKWGDTRDNLTELFSTGQYGRYELTLILEVLDERQQEKLDFEAAAIGTLLDPTDDLALERWHGEGGQGCTDHQNADPEYLRVVDLVATADYEKVCGLLEEAGFNPTDWDDPRTTPAQDLVEMRRLLLSNWERLALTLAADSAG